MGSKVSKTQRSQAPTRQSRFEKRDTPKSVQTGTFAKNGKPRPKPPKSSKAELLEEIDFNDIDEIALQTPSDLLLSQFWRLVEYLVVTPDGNVLSDLMKIRAIYRWIMSYDILNIDTDIIPPDDSILEYFMKIQCDLADHPQLLYTLCSLAGIPCVIINGMAKSNLYEIGGEVDRDSMSAQWSAVYVENEWRLIDCFWSAVCVESRTSSDYITVSKKGEVSRIFENDTDIVPYNDFYFLVDPKVLIWTHFPDDEEWQLLEKPISRKEFEDRQYIREQFHLLGMSIPEKSDTKSCVIESNGECVEIEFNLPVSRSGNYKFACTLCQSRNQVDTNQPVDVLLERFVLMEHSADKVKFTIRFPFAGLFQMDIYAVDVAVSKTYKLITSYLINCKELEQPFLPFPDCPDLGWGPNPVAREAGITLIKPKESGVIRTSTGLIELTFQVNNISFISHILKSLHLNDALLSRHVYSRHDRDKYIVNIRLPTEGEYALKIFVDDGQYIQKHMPTDIMHFLIVFEGENKTNFPFPYIIGGHIGTKAYAEKFGVDVLSYPMGLVKAWHGKTRLEFETHVKNISLTYDLCGCLRESHSRASATVINNECHWVFDVELPVPGEYSMNVFAMLDDCSTLYEVQSYLITSIVKSNKRVKFEDDYETEDIITATIRTSDENVTIPIPKADETEKIFSRMYRKDGKDDENGKKPIVINTGESFEINMKGDGEYEMDVWVKDEEQALETVAKFSICRRPSIESYSDDIDALVRMLKPQEINGSEIDEHRDDENYEEYNDLEAGDDKADSGAENEEEDDTGHTDHRESGEKEDEEEEEDHVHIAPKPASNDVKKDDDVDSKSQDVGELEEEEDDTASTRAPESDVDQKSTVDSVFGDDAAAIVVVADTNNPKSVDKNDIECMSTKTDGSVQTDPVTISDPPGDENTHRIKRRGDQRLDSMTSTNLGLVAAHVIKDNEKGDETKSIAESAYDGSETNRTSISSTAEVLNQPEEEMDEHQRDRYQEAKRRIVRRKLHKALREKKLSSLVQCFKEYKSTCPPREDELRKEARRIINFLQAKEELIDATLNKDPEVLRRAIMKAQKYNINMTLTVQILLATRILERLNRIKKISSTVLEMNQSSVTEMKKYVTPPNGVHQSLAATLLLLGEKSSDLKQWKTCQSALFKTGKDNIMRKISSFDPRNISIQIKDAAEKILRPFTLVQVRDVSKGAAAFYAWSSSMIEEIESYRNSMRTSGKSSGRHNRPRSATLRGYSAKREGTIVMRI